MMASDEKRDPQGQQLPEDKDTQRSMSSAADQSECSPMFAFSRLHLKTAPQKVVPLSNNFTQVYLNPNLRDGASDLDPTAGRPQTQMSFDQPQLLNRQPYQCPELLNAASNASGTFPQIEPSTQINGHNEDTKPVNSWRDDQERDLNMFRVHKKFCVADDRAFQRHSLGIWYKRDAKGKRQSKYNRDSSQVNLFVASLSSSALYRRQVLEQNDLIQTVVDLDRLELLKNREDQWPCKVLRKRVKWFAIQVNIFALNIIKHKSFEAITIAVIIANCITLAMTKANEEPSESEKMTENIFQALYTVEMVLKILGLGFIFNPGSYLRDPFNILDFFIVMSAYISMLDSENSNGGGVSLTSLRAFRVLKPLRAVNNIPGLRLIVQAILSALPLLKDTIIVLIFFFLIFAIGGVNLFSGMLRQRCINIETGSVQVDEYGDQIICGSVQKCQDGFFCGKRILNPNYDVTSFDNIFWAMLAIFQCVTLEGWSDLMVMYQRVYTYYVFLFFVPLVFIGAFFLLNLTLAVIQQSFNEAQDRIKQRKLDAEVELQKLFSQKQDDEELYEKQANQNDDDAKLNKKIGIMQFFTAKKAAGRLIKFSRIYFLQLEEKRKQAQREFEEKDERLPTLQRRRSSISRNGSLKSPSSPRSPKQLMSPSAPSKLITRSNTSLSPEKLNSPCTSNASLQRNGDGISEPRTRRSKQIGKLEMNDIRRQDSTKNIGRRNQRPSSSAMIVPSSFKSMQRSTEHLLSREHLMPASKQSGSRQSLTDQSVTLLQNAPQRNVHSPDLNGIPRLNSRQLFTLDQLAVNNQVRIIEEESSDENRSVLEFLDGLKNDQEENDLEVENVDASDSQTFVMSEFAGKGIDSLMGPSVSFPSMKYQSFAGRRILPLKNSLHVVMAFNDLRRANPPTKRNISYNETVPQVMLRTEQEESCQDEIINRMRRKSTMREQFKQKKLKIRLKDELDYDKMMHDRVRFGLNTFEKSKNRIVKLMRNNLTGDGDDYDKSFVEDNQYLPHDSLQPDSSILKTRRSASFSQGQSNRDNNDEPAILRSRRLTVQSPQSTSQIRMGTDGQDGECLVKSQISRSQSVGSRSSRSCITSVISSTSSIMSELDKCVMERRRIELEQRQQAREQARTGTLNREINPNIKNLLTSLDYNINRSRSYLNLREEPSNCNDDNTTFYCGQSVKQQIDLFSNLNEPINLQKIASCQDEMAIQKKEQETKIKMRKGEKTAHAKKIMSQAYKEVDLKDFIITDKNNPYTAFDESKQKIQINPGVAYRSTSQNDVFELRNKLEYNQRLKDLNRFIIIRGEGEDQDKHQHRKKNTKTKVIKSKYRPEVEGILQFDAAESDDTMYIRAPFKPWQLKNKLKVKVMDEFNFDDDDEDALVLQQQPFETVMSICQSDMLNHLNTKFLTRRSDIIVSSTLSFTLTPQDDFLPTSFAKLTREEIDKYVDYRSEFRAKTIKQFSIYNDYMSQLSPSVCNSPTGRLKSILSESDDANAVEDSFMSQASRRSDQSANDVGSLDMLASHHKNTYKSLPRTLLSAPLGPGQAGLLSQPDQRTYNIQKAKWEGEQRRLDKLLLQPTANSPRDRLFTEEDVEQMIAGEYWSDSDNDEEMPVKLTTKINGKAEADEPKADKTVLLGRIGLNQQFHLHYFESAVDEIKEDNQYLEDKLEELLELGHIPAEIRQELNLPKDMCNRDINFNEVRIMDSIAAIKQQVWSGQDVLATSINTQQSNWVVSKINSVRVWPKGFMNFIKKARAVLKMHVTSPFFEHLMTFCVLLNTVVMSLDHYQIEPETENLLNSFSDLFTYIFIYEMSVKLMAIGPKKYVASKWNLLDGGVVLLSIVEIIVEQQKSSESSASGLSAFRTVKIFRMFRVLRVARILRALKSMQVIIGVISRSFRSFMYVILLLLLFIFIYALLGVQIYQGKYDFGPDEPIPSGNYEEFTLAFITVFQVLTMENWQTVMYDSMRSAQGSTFLKSLTAIYYVSWIFIGNFILLNLFLAILIDSFAGEGAEADASHEDHMEAEKKATEIRGKNLQELKNKRRKKLKASFKRSYSGRRGGLILVPKSTQNESRIDNAMKKDETFEIVDDLDELDQKQIEKMLIKSKIVREKPKQSKDWIIHDDIECQNSIYCFSRTGLFRRSIYHVQQHRYFDRFIMFLIAISSLNLAFETYIQDLDKEDTIIVVNNIIGQVFTYCFMLEFLFKLIALGFVMEKGSYLRESWNQLDFFIVLTSLIDNMMASSDIAALKILRMLRILRPLRVVSHNVQLKTIVAALLDAGGSILNVIFVILIVWLMFAIFAVSTYKGHFFYCSIDKYQYSDKYECQRDGGEWLRYDSNFDDVGQAMMTLFIVASLEGWPSIMYQAIEITKEGQGPKYQNNVKQAFFFIIFILIGSMFFINFFIGVLFLKYSEAQKRETAGFTEEQLNWKEMQDMILTAEVPYTVTNKPKVWQTWRLKLYYLVTGNVFEVSILTVIVLNMLQMAIVYEGQTQTINEFMEISNYIFTAIFIAEAVLKIFVFHWAYFKTGWNKFDFFVVLSSIFDIIMTIYQEKSQDEMGSEVTVSPQDQQSEQSGQAALSAAPQLARVLRVLRVSRVLRIAKHYVGLQQLCNTIVLSVSGLINVFMLLMLFFFILAILGQFMFNGVKRGEIIDEYKNFQVFDRSFLLLFSISTGEDWNIIMYDCNHTLPNCIPGETCGSGLAPVYFISVIVLATYIMLNLFILVIIQQFEKLYLAENGPLQLFNRDNQIITAAWIRCTIKNGCIKLKASQVQDFLKVIPQPLGCAEMNDAQITAQVLKMGIKSEDGFIFFNELLYRILRKQYGNFQLNKQMQNQELITQFKLFHNTTSMSKVNRTDGLKKFFRKVGSGGTDTVNPFLTQMYFRISFVAWFNTMQRHERDIDLKRFSMINAAVKEPVQRIAENSSQQTLDDEEDYEAVVVEYEAFSEYTVSSEEEAALDDKPGTDNNDNFISNQSHLGDMLPGLHSRSPLGINIQQSPKSRRHNSKLRMASFNEKKRDSARLFNLKRQEPQTNQYLSPEKNKMIQRLVKKPSIHSSAKRNLNHNRSETMRERFSLTPDSSNKQIKRGLTSKDTGKFQPLLTIANETGSSQEADETIGNIKISRCN